MAHGGQHVFARLESGDGLRGGETVGIGCPKLQRALAVGSVATVFGDGRTGAGNGPVLIVLSVLEAAVRYVILGGSGGDGDGDGHVVASVGGAGDGVCACATNPVKRSGLPGHGFGLVHPILIVCGHLTRQLRFDRVDGIRVSRGNLHWIYLGEHMIGDGTGVNVLERRQRGERLAIEIEQSLVIDT